MTAIPNASRNIGKTMQPAFSRTNPRETVVVSRALGAGRAGRNHEDHACHGQTADYVEGGKTASNFCHR